MGNDANDDDVDVPMAMMRIYEQVPSSSVCGYLRRGLSVLPFGDVPSNKSERAHRGLEQYLGWVCRSVIRTKTNHELADLGASGAALRVADMELPEKTKYSCHRRSCRTQF
ncbi:unnamed protein product [Prunus armeniaca]|uniref:Uncharacterized protein n=1 Tax=Prunus armeniaca TaxID=36596 RepID=A0A6J5TXM3_PRUAR|nr:unnamed protein product [Prunus armeniaca]